MVPPFTIGWFHENIIKEGIPAALMPVSIREKLFGRIYGVTLTVVGFVLIYASYTSIVELGEYWKFFFVFGLVLVAMGLPILLLRVR